MFKIVCFEQSKCLKLQNGFKSVFRILTQSYGKLAVASHVELTSRQGNGRLRAVARSNH